MTVKPLSSDQITQALKQIYPRIPRKPTTIGCLLTRRFPRYLLYQRDLPIWRQLVEVEVEKPAVERHLEAMVFTSLSPETGYWHLLKLTLAMDNEMNTCSQEAPQALHPQHSTRLMWARQMRFRTLPDCKASPCKRNKVMPKELEIDRIMRNLKVHGSATPTQTESIAARPGKLGHSDGPAESP